MEHIQNVHMTWCTKTETLFRHRYISQGRKGFKIFLKQLVPMYFLQERWEVGWGTGSQH